MAAGTVDPEIASAIAPYLTMSGGPSSLDAVEPRARAVYQSGWRPTFTPGPTGEELRSIVREALLSSV